MDSSLFTWEGRHPELPVGPNGSRYVAASADSLHIMATEVQSGDLESATSSRLEVSIDGLTLSPDPEGEHGQAEELNPSPVKPEDDTPFSSGDEDGETGKSAIEGKWGFPLLELYGLGLKFFKGILQSLL